MAYSPATNLTTSAGLAHLQQVYYKKKGLDQLRKKFVFRQAAMPDVLPKFSGRTAQFYRYTNLATNTTATTEGTVGTGVSLGSRTLQATVSQYSAFITVSDFLKDTALDPIVQRAAEELGYSAGLSVDTMTRNVIDAESAGTAQTPLATYAKVADFRAARHNLQAVDVQGFDGSGEFFAIIHPYASYDLVNDPAAGGLGDIVKYTKPQGTVLTNYEDRGAIGSFGGCRIIESTNVKTGSSPNTYRSYVFGNEGVGCIDLEGRGPGQVVDPKKQRFKIKVIQPEASIADPEGVIGAAVAYNFVFCTVVLDGPASIGGVYRYKTIDFQSTIS